MKKSIVFIGGILIIISGMLAFISPDKLSMAIVVVMGVLVMLGFIFGITPLLQSIGAFKQACRHLDDIKKINSDNLWIPLGQVKSFFGQKKLDELFADYIDKAAEQREQGVVISDIESVINEDSLSVRSWRGVVLQIAGTLTALGLLGTFFGLVTGISGVTFGTLQDTVSGIENMLKGITTAFYTSIVGVILSIIFNAIYRIIWNMALRELQLFTERFHLDVQPEADELIRAKQYLNTERMIGYLSDIHDMGVKMVGMTNAAEAQEQRVMIELLSGVQKGEMTFSLQPVCSLADRSVVKAEVNLRWTHEQLGIISPDTYMPIVKSNGYIVKLNTAVWEQACAMLQAWCEKGIQPLPLVLKVTKTDILSTDIAAYISGLVERYQLAPRNLELALEAAAYSICYKEVSKLEKALLQKGFRVSVYGFDGDFIGLKKISADELTLDLKTLSKDENIVGIFDQASHRHINLTACGIDSAKMLAEVKKAGCGIGQGSHLYGQLTRKEFESLMKYDS